MEDRLQLLGKDHPLWGQREVRTTRDGRSAAAISVGSDPGSPSLTNKGDPALPNEDAALVLEDGSRTLLAVADAHHGHRASHEPVQALGALDSIPADPSSLAAAISRLPRSSDPEDRSASTLLVAVVDRDRGAGFGVSFGDSSLVRIAEGGVARINVRHADFIHLRGPDPIDPENAYQFRFFLSPGELVLAHTDGVDECHYRSPATSIGTAHLAEIFLETGASPGAFAEALVDLALAGVGGHPGGQDNVALAVTGTGAG